MQPVTTYGAGVSAHKVLFMYNELSEVGMRSYPLHEARSKFSMLIDRALAGEPQRVTRHGKEAVVIISEAAWNGRPKSASTLADLFANTIGADKRVKAEIPMRQRWAKDKRPLGAEFAE
jgi:prevent-host-death family protein